MAMLGMAQQGKARSNTMTRLLSIIETRETIELCTSFDYPPIPNRGSDWSAIDSNTYDADCDQDGFFSMSPCGRGTTEIEAIDALLEQL